jgi:hypothetical protein
MDASLLQLRWLGSPDNATRPAVSASSALLSQDPAVPGVSHTESISGVAKSSLLCGGSPGYGHRVGSKQHPRSDLTGVGPIRHGSTRSSPLLHATETSLGGYLPSRDHGRLTIHRSRSQPSRSFVTGECNMTHAIGTIPRLFLDKENKVPRVRPSQEIGFSPNIQSVDGHTCTLPCMGSYTCISHLHAAAPAATCTELSAHRIRLRRDVPGPYLLKDPRPMAVCHRPLHRFWKKVNMFCFLASSCWGLLIQPHEIRIAT